MRLVGHSKPNTNRSACYRRYATMQDEQTHYTQSMRKANSCLNILFAHTSRLVAGYGYALSTMLSIKSLFIKIASTDADDCITAPRTELQPCAPLCWLIIVL